MLFKTLITLVTVALSLTVSPIYATQWTVTATGTILESYGADYAHIFGPNNDCCVFLNGAPYTLTITTDPALNAKSSGYPINNPSENISSGGALQGGYIGNPLHGSYGAPATITATVNGISFTDTVDPNVMGSINNNLAPIFNTAVATGVNEQWFGQFNLNSFQLTSGVSGYTQNQNSNTLAEIAALGTYLSSDFSFNQSLTLNNLTNNSVSIWAVSFGNGNEQASAFEGNITSLSINAPATVPIPPTLWLVGSGLVGLFGFARRKPT